MKTIVVYKSKSNFVKNYADWIAKNLSADIFEASTVTSDKLLEYDTIIYGGGLYAGRINGVKLIKKNIHDLKGKNIVVFFSGASSPNEKAINEVKNNNFDEEMQKNIRFFYLRGGFDYNKLKSFDKLLMNMLKFTLKRKKNLSADDRGMLSAYDNPVDFTKEKNIDELISYVNSKAK
ncbi:flavodoxin domain-containing protein [Helicovermis profundi]|uniref:Flavodoxin domain-containing protein n=1 Tax=Helicovermis profundi TaxID=3065157 RepID=A0AAU9E9W3_9FIRM|nr:flavodoxin domain-containing protein [Clostridia bacterium S502]